MKRLPALCLSLALTSIATAQTPPLQKGISVQLPTTSSATTIPMADKADALIVSITQAGIVYLGTEPVAPADLAQKVRTELNSRSKKDLYIKADARVSYARIVEVLDAIHAAGIEAVTLLTSQQEVRTPGKLVSPKGLEMTLVPAHGSR